jgi:hypothetical protein
VLARLAAPPSFRGLLYRYSVRVATVEELENRLQATGKNLAAAREVADIHRDEAITLAGEAAAAGVSQYRIAELLGVDRMTIRKWVGKR